MIEKIDYKKKFETALFQSDCFQELNPGGALGAAEGAAAIVPGSITTEPVFNHVKHQLPWKWLTDQTMTDIAHLSVFLTLAFFFFLCCSTSDTVERKPMVRQLVLRRFRRGFGYRTICLERPKKFCTMIKYRSVLRKYCITENTLHCTGLD